MKKSKYVLLFGTMMLSAALMFGCGKKKDGDTTEDNTAATVPVVNVSTVESMGDAEDIQIFYKEGYVLSELTGEWIDESLENQRPVAIMINNIKEAMPQSSISKADVTYEMIVEGGITRLLAVFKDYASLDKVGPIRSSRHYYVQLANMMDDIYAHIGWSPYAEEEIKNSGCNNLNGLFDSTTFYRDNSRYAPHNVYSDGPKIVNGIASMGYSTTYQGEIPDMYDFNYKDTNLNSGKAANKINVFYSDYQHPWFEYNAEDQRYYRFQYGDKHIDEFTGEQLSYKNVVVMFAIYTSLVDAYVEPHLYAEGDVIYATNGEYVDGTWRYENGVINFYNEDGSKLKFNPGNTFICVPNIYQKDSTTVE